MQTTVNYSTNGKQRQITEKTEVKRKNLYTIYKDVCVSLQRQWPDRWFSLATRVKLFEGLGRNHREPQYVTDSFFLIVFISMYYKTKQELIRKIGLFGLSDVSRLAPIGDLGYANGWYPCSLFPSQGTWMDGGMEKAVYDAAREQGYRFEVISHRETGSDTCYYCRDLHMYYHVDSSG